VGFKYKMSNIQAAIGCAQMERLEELINRKREILKYYRKRLEKLHGVKMNPEPTGMVNGAWMPSVVFDPETGVTQEILQQALTADNIDARVFFHPLSILSMFEDQRQNYFARVIPGRAMNLPSYHDMTTVQQDRVIEILEFVSRRARKNVE